LMHNPPVLSGRRLFPVALVALIAAAVVGCGTTTDDRPAKWSFISPAITEPSCATVNCHSAIAQKAGVDLHDRASGYATLAGRGFVDPSNPDGSAVIHMMRGEGSLRMPPDEPLPEVDIQLIRNWIAAGATDD
jgi:hypothetical protein